MESARRVCVLRLVLPVLQRKARNHVVLPAVRRLFAHLADLCDWEDGMHGAVFAAAWRTNVGKKERKERKKERKKGKSGPKNYLFLFFFFVCLF